MTQEEKIKNIIEMCSPCIILRPVVEHSGRYKYLSEFRVIGESKDCIGCSHGVGSRYDLGFLSIDAADGISVIILN